MVKKLPQFVETWITEHATFYIDRHNDDGSAIMGVDVDDLREFLANYVLCDADPIGYLMYDKTSPLEYTADQRLAGAVGSTCPVYTTPELKTAPFHYPSWPGTV
jgi:hypothetical protein